MAAGWLDWLSGPGVTRRYLSRDRLVTFAFCLAVFSVGLHLFFRWLHGELRTTADATCRRDGWSPRWSGMILASLILMFSAGIATVGVTHQTVWLLRSRESSIKERFQLSKLHRQTQCTTCMKLGSEFIISSRSTTVGFRRRPRVSVCIVGGHYSALHGVAERGHGFRTSMDDPRNAPCFRGLRALLSQSRDRRAPDLRWIRSQPLCRQRGESYPT